MRISDWSSDVCSSDLMPPLGDRDRRKLFGGHTIFMHVAARDQGIAARRRQAIGKFELGMAADRRDRLGGATAQARKPVDRKSVVEGKSVSVRVDLGGRRIIKKKKQK